MHSTHPAVGQVQLPTVNLGDTNFEDGFGAPGWLLEEFPSGYTAHELTGGSSLSNAIFPFMICSFLFISVTRPLPAHKL